jgi:DNA-binding transcriptional ArsR family regulator
MASIAAFAETAALVGDPARANMLAALLEGRALTAGELARVAGIAPQTASGHLARLTTAGPVAVQRQGRHHYHSLASATVARMLEGIMDAAESGPARRRAKSLSTGPRDAQMRAARTCYDHLAGRLGVALADALTERGWIELSPDGGAVTEAGDRALRGFGLDLDAAASRARSATGRVFCRPCVDWSERRPHVAGAVGAGLCTRLFALGWIRRIEGSRAVAVTRAGERGFRETFAFQPG